MRFHKKRFALPVAFLLTACSNAKPSELQINTETLSVFRVFTTKPISPPAPNLPPDIQGTMEYGIESMRRIRAAKARLLGLANADAVAGVPAASPDLDRFQDDFNYADPSLYMAQESGTEWPEGDAPLSQGEAVHRIEDYLCTLLSPMNTTWSCPVRFTMAKYAAHAGTGAAAVHVRGVVPGALGEGGGEVPLDGTFVQAQFIGERLVQFHASYNYSDILEMKPEPASSDEAAPGSQWQHYLLPSTPTASQLRQMWKDRCGYPIAPPPGVVGAIEPPVAAYVRYVSSYGTARPFVQYGIDGAPPRPCDFDLMYVSGTNALPMMPLPSTAPTVTPPSPYTPPPPFPPPTCPGPITTTAAAPSTASPSATPSSGPSTASTLLAPAGAPMTFGMATRSSASPGESGVVPAGSLQTKQLMVELSAFSQCKFPMIRTKGGLLINTEEPTDRCSGTMPLCYTTNPLSRGQMLYLAPLDREAAEKAMDPYSGTRATRDCHLGVRWVLREGEFWYSPRQRALMELQQLAQQLGGTEAVLRLDDEMHPRSATPRKIAEFGQFGAVLPTVVYVRFTADDGSGDVWAALRTDPNVNVNIESLEVVQENFNLPIRIALKNAKSKVVSTRKIRFGNNLDFGALNIEESMIAGPAFRGTHEHPTTPAKVLDWVTWAGSDHPAQVLATTVARFANQGGYSLGFFNDIKWNVRTTKEAIAGAALSAECEGRRGVPGTWNLRRWPEAGDAALGNGSLNAYLFNGGPACGGAIQVNTTYKITGARLVAAGSYYAPGAKHVLTRDEEWGFIPDPNNPINIPNLERSFGDAGDLAIRWGDVFGSYAGPAEVAIRAATPPTFMRTITPNTTKEAFLVRTRALLDAIPPADQQNPAARALYLSRVVDNLHFKHDNVPIRAKGAWGLDYEVNDWNVNSGTYNDTVFPNGNGVTWSTRRVSVPGREQPGAAPGNPKYPSWIYYWDGALTLHAHESWMGARYVSDTLNFQQFVADEDLVDWYANARHAQGDDPVIGESGGALRREFFATPTEPPPVIVSHPWAKPVFPR